MTDPSIMFTDKPVTNGFTVVENLKLPTDMIYFRRNMSSVIHDFLVLSVS